MLILGPEGTGTASYELSKRLEVRIYELREGGAVTGLIPTGQGVDIASTIIAEKIDSKIHIKVEPPNEASITVIRLFSCKYRILGSNDNAIRVNEGESDVVIEVEEL